jgi:RNA polymerase sigma factor (sigma-70 family)
METTPRGWSAVDGLPARTTPTTAPGSAGRWLLVLPHRARLVRLAAARLGNTSEAEDCVHEAMLRTCLYAHLDEDRVGSFLSTVVIRLCVDRHRSSSRARVAWSKVGEPADDEGPEDLVCNQLTGAWLMERLESLSSRERGILTARAGGLSTREAARWLGITDKAAESAFTRGRAKLLNQAKAA